MRRFVLDSGPTRKSVTLEIRGDVLRVTQGKADGTTQRSEKTLPSEADARRAAERMASELTARGFREQTPTTSKAPATPSRRPAVAAASRSAILAAEPAGGGGGAFADLDDVDLSEADSSEEAAEPLLPRQRATAAPAAPAKKPKAKKKGKKKKKAGAGDGPGTGGDLDKRVIAGIGALVLLAVAGVGYFAYDAFLKPPSIVGHWEGSRTEHEIGKKLSNTSYSLILDGQNHATMTVEKFTTKGTYAITGNKIHLTTKDEDGEVVENEYRFALRRAALDLFDPVSGDKVVQLIRFHQQIAAQAEAPAPAAPKDLAEPPANAAADEKLASVDFASKDGAFRLKRPASWTVESGVRVDNTYSWARFTKGSAKVQLYADIAGSLMTGASQNQHEEGSELAPVHRAHELYARSAAENYSDYKESAPTLFKSATGGLGEGRIATFTASGGLFGSKIRGFRVTFLTNDRRISLLCEAPEGEFAAVQPTLLAIARSVAR